MRRSRRAFTLVEVLVAIAVLGIVSAGLIGFFATIVTTARNAEREQSQAIAAKTFLEQVAEAWQDHAEFMSEALVPDGLVVPLSCAVTSGEGFGEAVPGVKTLVLTCDSVPGPFVLSKGSVR